MKKSRPSFAWLQLVITLIVFVAVLAVAIFYQNQLKEAVLVPLLYLLWVGELAFKSFDQRCIWLLGLVIALFLSLSVFRGAKKTAKFSAQVLHQRNLAAGRIHFWRTQVRVNSSPAYAQSYRRSELRRLVIKALASHGNCDEQRIIEQLRTGELRVPPEVSYFLGIESLPAEPDQPVNFFQGLQQRFVWITARFRTPQFLPDPRLQQVAEYLERFMEVENDPGNR